MRKILVVTFVELFLIIPFACNDIDLFVDCDSCYLEKPKSTTLYIDLTINDENNYIPLTIYSGTMEDGVIIKEVLTNEKNYPVKVDLDNYYTVQANYNSNGKVIHVINGRLTTTKRINNICNNPCYIITGDRIDARLKY